MTGLRDLRGLATRHDGFLAMGRMRSRGFRTVLAFALGLALAGCGNEPKREPVRTSIVRTRRSTT